MFDLWDTEDKIKYALIAPKLFPGSGRQEIVPFLGAGVSVAPGVAPDEEPAPEYPSADTVARIAELLKIDADSTLFLEFAVRLAVWMQAWVKKNGPGATPNEFYDRVVKSPYPPFVWELAEIFSARASYTSFGDRPLRSLNKRKLVPPERLDDGKRETLIGMLKLASRGTDLGSSTDPLTAIASYYQMHSDRQGLWDELKKIFAPKKKPNAGHELIADAAAGHLKADDAEPYLIITTNYDTLMERALDDRKVPYAAMWWNRADGQIHRRFRNIPDNRLARLEERSPVKAPKEFRVGATFPLVLLYKMHGCLDESLNRNDDGVIITEADYVEFIANLDAIIPGHVGSILGNKRLLFMGYSFGDWNVRAIYETASRLTTKPRDTKDYAVTKSLSTFERMYFHDRSIDVALTDLDTFAAGIRAKGGVAL